MNRINTPINLIKTKKARNPIIMPAMDTLMAKDGIPNNFHLQHYGSRAYGGVGTIITESTAVSPEGRIRDQDLGLWNDDQTVMFSQIATLVHQAGALIGVQLNHAGGKAQLSEATRGVTNYYSYLDQSRYHLMNREELQVIEDNFVAAAARAKQAGMDFVELHAAHGYLLNEIWHPVLNEVIKTDDIVQRSQLIINVARRIRTEVNFPVGIKFSVLDDILSSPLKIVDLKPLIEALEPYLDFIEVSSGDTLGHRDINELINESGSKMFRIPYAEQIKQYTKHPVAVVGNFQTREDALAGLNKGIDAISIGREMLFNPNLVVNSLLLPSEMDEKIYHWNNNIWYDPVRYANLLASLKKTHQ